MKGYSTDRINTMFSRIAGVYDFMNDIISLGTHRQIRKKLIDIAEIKPDYKILDCATGTGTLAVMMYRASGGRAQITGIDNCHEMLEIARKKHHHTHIRWIYGDCHSLPFPDKTFDLTTIAFGIRNMEDPLQVLKEMARVTKSGKKVIILEGGKPHIYFLPLFYVYSFIYLPFVGALFARNPAAYLYLGRSIKSFYSMDEFLELMKKSELFTEVTGTSFAGGICYICSGKVR